MDKQNKSKLILSATGIVVVAVFAALFFPKIKYPPKKIKAKEKIEVINYDSIFVNLVIDTTSKLRTTIDSIIECKIELIKTKNLPKIIKPKQTK